MSRAEGRVSLWFHEPADSLQTFLYGSGKKPIKRDDGRFAVTTAPLQTKQPVRPTKAKRKISPEGRKWLAEAARKRWADTKKPQGK